jgi:hypothetical protein
VSNLPGPSVAFSATGQPLAQGPPGLPGNPGVPGARGPTGLAGMFGTLVLPPSVSTLTWVQQAGLISGAASAVDSPGGGFDILSPPIGDNAKCMHCVVASAPAAPWTFTVGLIFEGPQYGGTKHLGLVLRESATSKLLVYNFSDSLGPGLGVSSWTDAQTWVTDDYIVGAVGSAINTVQPVSDTGFLGPIFLRVVNDGTNLTWYRSISNTNFFSQGVDGGTGRSSVPIAKNNFFATGPTQLGVGVSLLDENAPPTAMHVGHWAITSP